jgi:hypothetical protein
MMRIGREMPGLQFTKRKEIHMKNRFFSVLAAAALVGVTACAEPETEAEIEAPATEMAPAPVAEPAPMTDPAATTGTFDPALDTNANGMLDADEGMGDADADGILDRDETYVPPQS